MAILLLHQKLYQPERTRLLDFLHLCGGTEERSVRSLNIRVPVPPKEITGKNHPNHLAVDICTNIIQISACYEISKGVKSIEDPIHGIWK